MKILFLGEDSLTGAGKYLAGILRWSKISFDYRPNETPMPTAWLKRHYDAVVLSDYRAVNWTPSALRWLKSSVQQRTGLGMIGGWASFTGQIGGYAGSAVEQLLPVRCWTGDDRVNRPALLRGKQLLSVVNGYHRCRLKSGSKVHLEFQDLSLKGNHLRLGKRSPALVTARYHRGRTLAFLSDCAPHWAGGLVDWGPRRISVAVQGRTGIEVGSRYLEFFRDWMVWLCGG